MCSQNLSCQYESNSLKNVSSTSLNCNEELSVGVYVALLLSEVYREKTVKFK